ncbi:hypothetical protein FRB95_000007 [Tulasnella sp. JGI-2019a]|nr:hypothetical protein FRB93_009554 [Tulasnella sp. JGI-2019a]KAG9040078.1 hypothetical protein FRB95_000007 [Tulasnella sp. JGI-2019a]
MSAQAVPSNVANQLATPSGNPVLLKLLLFTVCLGLAPIGTYYLSQKYIWEGNGTYAAITSIFAANIVLVAYIISSIMDDSKDQQKAVVAAKKNGTESRKDR